MFFMTMREPNGAASDYFGGFGRKGNKSFQWAVEKRKGFAEFDPSVFPHGDLYEDLGDPTVCEMAWSG